ncbi:MAG: serine protease [Chloroflexota bacterium]
MRGAAVVAALLLVVGSGVGASAASPVASGAPAASGAPVVALAPLPVPPAATLDGPPVRLSALDRHTADAYAAAALVQVGGGCSGVLIAPRPGPIPADAPATVLTNGHCIDFLAPTAVVRDTEPSGTVTFGWEGSGTVDAVASVAAIPWASMKGTDLAILTLGRPVADLVARGIRPLPLAATAPAAGTQVVIVGAPSHPDQPERVLELATCTLGPTHALVEGEWSFTGFPSNHCGDIRPGSSGSPVIDPATGEVVGLVNTGTAGSEGLSDCVIDRPCEVGPEGGQSIPDTVYGPLLAGLGGCFDDAWAFTGPGAGCPLDPGIGVSVEGATVATNPDATPISGRLPATTWNATLVPSDPRVDHVRAKTGPLGSVDCHDPAGYGPVQAIADQPFVDLPLPDAEGRVQLCLLAGPGTVPDGRWQEPRFATVVTAWIDKTPPLPPIRLDATSDAVGWTVTPVPMDPELVAFRWKWGPQSTTDCADPAGYAVWRHAPRRLPRAAEPTRLCVIGYDEASNPSAPLDRVLS